MPHRIPCPRRRLVAAAAVCIALLAGATAEARAGELAVESDFPGGSVHVDAIDQEARGLRVQPANHPGKGWRCWWFFKVTGIEPGETLTLTVTGGGFALPNQAAWSLDGRSWRQTAPGTRSKNRVTYTQAVPASEAYFAWGPPFLPRHAEALLADANKECNAAERFVLCRTREDRPTPALRIEPAASDAKPVLLWVQARQHAWESGASWVADGFTRWLCSRDGRARAVRRQCRTVIVPIMDVDNVVRGAGGKNQRPQDHNRDWSDEPHWPAVAAAQRMLRDLSPRARLTVFIDLHNPGPGKRDQEVFFYICPRNHLSPRRQDLLDALVAAAKAEMTAPLGFRGQTRESGAGYDENWKRISKNWVAEHLDGPLVAVTMETGWQTPHSTREGYVTVGRQLGLAVERFLREAAE
ncbi:MAG: M14 family zinc carboxypeptidase [Phycisphaerae bacterium]